MAKSSLEARSSALEHTGDGEVKLFGSAVLPLRIGRVHYSVAKAIAFLLAVTVVCIFVFRSIPKVGKAHANFTECSFQHTREFRTLESKDQGLQLQVPLGGAQPDLLLAVPSPSSQLDNLLRAHAAFSHGSLDCADVLSISTQAPGTWAKLICLREEVLATPPGKIPKIIHQAWSGSTGVPHRLWRWQESWPRNHPSWKYVLWNREDNQNLMQTFYPWLLDTYEALPQEIQRLDLVRYVYMHLLGGMYADLDFDALRPLDELLANASAVIAAMATDSDNAGLKHWDHNIPNAWMASAPGQQFWMFCIQQVIKNAAMLSEIAEQVGSYVESTTGPIMFTQAAALYALRGTQPPLTVLPPPLIYPIDWRRRGNSTACQPGGDNFNEAACKAALTGAYAVTYFLHGWR